MPKHPPSDATAMSVRLPMALFGWIKELADAQREPITSMVRKLLEDYRTFFGLPEPIMAHIEADMKARGIKDGRGYMQHLIARRIKEIIANGPGYDEDKGEKSGRR